MPRTLGVSHLGLTVRDANASAAWYQRVLGWQVLARREPPEVGTPRLLLRDPNGPSFVSLCEPGDRSGDRFDYRRTGLDHLALEVPDEAELGRWAEHLDQLRVPHSPVREMGSGARFVSFEDPDGIQFELWLTPK